MGKPQGKVLASFLVRVTLREGDNTPPDATVQPEDIPTNDRLSKIVSDAVYAYTDFLPDEIHVESERTDI